MTSENMTEAAAARLRAAGLPEPVVQAIAGRAAATIEQLRRQAAAITPKTEPATTFTAARPPGTD